MYGQYCDAKVTFCLDICWVLCCQNMRIYGTQASQSAYSHTSLRGCPGPLTQASMNLLWIGLRRGGRLLALTFFPAVIRPAAMEALKWSMVIHKSIYDGWIDMSASYAFYTPDSYLFGSFEV